jgi:hypothetical protein
MRKRLLHKPFKFAKKLRCFSVIVAKGGGKCLFSNKTADPFQYVQEAVLSLQLKTPGCHFNGQSKMM